MYVATSKTTKNGKTHVTHMLRHSYRENGKVKHKNIGCLNTCSPEEILAIKLALKNKKNLSSFVSPQALNIKQGPSFGATFAAHSIAKSLKIDKALGKDEQGQIAMLQVLARIIGQGSKLKAVRMQETHAFAEIIGLNHKINDDKIYRNLDWIAKEQLRIEKELWQYNGTKEESHLFLYDVTSTYLEGEANEYAAFGYNRDGKKAKKQIVIGLLTNKDGLPIKVTVFDGNTNDTKTFGMQVKASAEQFGVQNVVFVGDRGMIKSPQIKELPEGCAYITAIGKREIETLINQSKLQLDLFDSKLCEVMNQETGERYVLRLNPFRRGEIRKARMEKIRRLFKEIRLRNGKLASSKRAKIETARKAIDCKVKQYKLESIFVLEEQLEGERKVRITVKRDVLKKAKELDGCYVLKSNLGPEVTKETIHSRYKDLKLVEDGFRTMKQSHLELRPVFVRKKKRTAAHVFVVMLAYMITRKMRQLLAESGEEILVPEMLESLNLLCLQEFASDNMDKERVIIYKLPEPSDLNKSYLERLRIKLPEVFVKGMTVGQKK